MVDPLTIAEKFRLTAWTAPAGSGIKEFGVAVMLQLGFKIVMFAVRSVDPVFLSQTVIMSPLLRPVMPCWAQSQGSVINMLAA